MFSQKASQTNNWVKLTFSYLSLLIFPLEYSSIALYTESALQSGTDIMSCLIYSIVNNPSISLYAFHM